MAQHDTTWLTKSSQWLFHRTRPKTQDARPRPKTQCKQKKKSFPCDIFGGGLISHFVQLFTLGSALINLAKAFSKVFFFNSKSVEQWTYKWLWWFSIMLLICVGLLSLLCCYTFAHIVATHTMNGGNIVSRKPTRHIFHAFEKREKEMDHKFLASYIRNIDLLPTFVHEN